MFGSYFFSILLHLALALLIFLWPSSPPVRLDQPMMQISVNMGAPGGNRMASPVLGPQGKPMPTKAAPQPAPAEQAASAVPVAREDTVQPKAEPKKESQPKPKPKPEPKPDEVALAQKKQPKKPKDEEEEEPKEKPKEKPKDDGKKDKKEASENAKKTDDKAKPAKESDKKKDGVDPSKALADALNDAKKKAGTSRGTKEKGGKSSVAGALADFQKSAGGAGGGGGGSVVYPSRPVGSYDSVVGYAMSRIGCPYIWGAEGPDSFDCSGLVTWAYRQVGMYLPHQSEAQYAAAARVVSVSEARPGDVLWRYGHVGIAVSAGGSHYVHAPTFNAYVRDTDPLSWAQFTNAMQF